MPSQEVIMTGTISPTVEAVTSSSLGIGIHGTDAFNLMTFGSLGCNRAIFGYHNPCENRQSNLSAAGEAVTTGNA